MRLISYFDQRAELHPNRLFLVGSDSHRTYAQTRIQSERIADGLVAAGAQPGDIAAVLSGNSVTAFECLMGLMRAGCVWAPINPRSSGEDIVDALNNTKAAILFYSAEFASLVQTSRATCPNLKTCICLTTRGSDAPDASSIPLESLIKDAPKASHDQTYQPETLCTLMSSGGTSGAPKGVMMPQRAWVSMVEATRHFQSTDEAPMHLVAAPMTHAAGGTTLLMAAMGATNIILNGFEPELVMSAIEKWHITHFFLPPTAIYRMLSHPSVKSYDYSTLRYFTYAGAPMAPERIKEAINIFGPVMTTAFGQMETGILNTCFSPQDHLDVLASGNARRLKSCGRVSPFVRLEIMDDAGNIRPPEQVGEIVVKGDQVMLGYFNQPEENATAFYNGWRRTGDIGVKDSEGWLYLIDRKRDMIISGGFNVFPADIERTLIGHPDVEDCAVVGIPHPDWGEAVTAVVELKQGHSIDAEALRSWARARLSGLSAPKSVLIWPQLPRSPAGKVLRRLVRETFWSKSDRQI